MRAFKIWLLLGSLGFVGPGCKCAGAEELDPYINLSFRNALDPGVRLGDRDIDFLKINLVKVQENWYDFYYSERVWPERPEKHAVTVQAEVVGHDMTIPFNDLQYRDKQACIRINVQNSFGQHEAMYEECSKQSCVEVHRFELFQDSMRVISADAVDPSGRIVAISDPIQIRFIVLPRWTPELWQPKLLHVEEADIEEDHDEKVAKWSLTARSLSNAALVTFLAEESDIFRFLEVKETWVGSLKLGTPKDQEGQRLSELAEGQGLKVHVFVALDAFHSTFYSAPELRQLGLEFELHVLQPPYYTAKLGPGENGSMDSWEANGKEEAHSRIPRGSVCDDRDHCSSTSRPHVEELDYTWPGAKGMVRRGYFLGANLLVHPAVLDYDWFMVMSPTVHFEGVVDWGFSADIDSGSWDLGTVYPRAHHGYHYPVATHDSVTRLYSQAMKFVTTDETHETVAPATGSQGGGIPIKVGKDAAIHFNAICPGSEDAAFICELDEHHHHSNWNRMIHFGQVQIYRRTVFASTAYSQFLWHVEFEENLREFQWDYRAIMSLFAILTTNAERFRDLSENVRFKYLDEDYFDHRLLVFPLQQELSPVTDVFNKTQCGGKLELVSVLDSEIKPRSFKTPTGQLNKTCYMLSPQLWPECKSAIQHHEDDSWLFHHEFQESSLGYRQLKNALGEQTPIRPFVKQAYIAKLKAGYLDSNPVHAAVHGTVYDWERMYLHQPYVRDACTQFWSRHHIMMRYVRRIIVGSNVPYPVAVGHVLTEVIPRVVWLATSLDETIPIIMILNPYVQQILDVLHSNGIPVGPDRVVPWEDSMILYGSETEEMRQHGRNVCISTGKLRPLTVYVADQIFFYGEWPFNLRNSPNAGGEGSYHPRPVLKLARQALLPPHRAVRTAFNMLIMKRPNHPWGRSIINHDEMVSAIIKTYPAASIHIFTGDGSVRSQFELFNSAFVVIGPHGAGFANLIACEPGTLVVEVGWGGDGGASTRQKMGTAQGMWLSDLFYSYSSALELDYNLVLSKSGGQTEGLEIEVSDILDILRVGLHSQVLEFASNSHATA